MIYKTQTALLATLIITLIMSLAGTNDVWALDDYYLDQWEIADKK